MRILVILLIVLLFPATVQAQEKQPVPSPVEYTLPYPGLLPDNPLYFFKAVRDTMQHFFVSNASKKAEFYLLQADKSLSASAMLTQRNETHELAGATAAESQRYFEKAIAEAAEAKQQGLAIDEVARKLILANEKHQETIKQMQGRVTEKHKELFVNAGKHAQQLEKKAQQLLPEK